MGAVLASPRQRMCLKFLAMATLALSAGTDAQLYDQPYDNSGGAAASQNVVDGLGNFATSFDNFTLSDSATLASLSFTGAFFNPSMLGTVNSFEVQIYADNGGQPGGSLASFAISGNGGQSCNSQSFCTYSVPIDFDATAGTEYWLSIVADSAASPQWGWAYSSTGDDLAYQRYFGVLSPLPQDFAFTLFAPVPEVPEPSTWAMMLLGLGTAGVALRRRGTRPSLA